MRVRSLASLAAAALLAAPVLVAAQYDPNAPPPGRRAPPPTRSGPRESGLTLAGRVGLGLPNGDISDEGIDPPLDDLVRSKVPIWLELGFRFNPTVWGGVYLELAPVNVKSAFCEPGRSCDGGAVRFGLDVQLHLAPYQRLDPWIGFGVGAEFITVETLVDVDGDGVGDVIGDAAFGGFELPLLEAGLDLALSPSFTLGPYVSWSLATYTSFSTDVEGVEDSGSIGDRATHGWLQVGLKATLKL